MASVAQASAAMPLDQPDEDPFVAGPTDASLRQRYAGFDANAFSLYSYGSPAQARRALEAHLAETERRLQEASQLGSRLINQRADLASKLKEVGVQNDGEDLDPQLRKKLVELEHEFNEVGKETARAFIPKSRVPSNESQKGNEAVLETGARDSPSKVQPPSMSSRKQRNQAPNRMNDIKLATEISSSLLNQVRDLQAAYAEKDEALKNALANKTQLETDMDGMLGRLRALDESEQRYKDENWNLETRLQELTATAKAAADREAKLTQHVNATNTDKSGLERELEELKQVHGKLSEDHRAFRKQHETEVSSLQRNASSVETERGTLQRKIEELTSQNQELAKAMAYKLRATDLKPTRELTPEEDDLNLEMGTPEHSPPPSPTKGTPRHGGLESETLKSSLHHAHRMIQNLKNNIHREKTEKLELRRMLQDARNELEDRRADGGSGAKKRKPRDELNQFKKPARPDRLGGARGSTTDIVMNDENWEDHEGAESPSRTAAGRANSKMSGTSEFETATEHSDDFETATEHEAGNGTETDAFHTGAESLNNSSDDLTETEAEPKKANRSTQKGHARIQSFQSTASTSGDEEDVKTPASQSLLSRLSRSFRGRGSVRAGTAGSFKDSPASVASETPSSSSTQNTPARPSLFAELADLEDDEDGSLADDFTPSRSVVSSHSTPAQKHDDGEDETVVDVKTPESITRDHDKSLLAKGKDAVGTALVGGLGFGLGRAVQDSEDTSAGAEPEKPAFSQHLSMSRIVSQTIEPVDMSIDPIVAVPFTTSAISSLHTEPQAPTNVPFATSAIRAQHTEPKAPVAVPLAASQITTQATEPETPTRTAFTASRIVSQTTQPVTPAQTMPKPSAPFKVSQITQQYAEEPTDAEELDRPATAKALTAADAGINTDAAPKESIGTQTSPMVDQPGRSSSVSASKSQPSPKPGLFGLLGLGKSKAQPETTIAEDETSTPGVVTPTKSKGPVERSAAHNGSPRPAAAPQPLRIYSDDVDGGSDLPGLENAREPMREINPNRQKERAAMLQGIELAKSLRTKEMTDSGVQTTVSSEDMDNLLQKKREALVTALGAPPATSQTNLPASPTRPFYAASPPRKSRESIIAADSQKVLRRPGSSGSTRSRALSQPPLPEGHRQAIAAATQRGPGAAAAAVVPTGAPTTPGHMGPPTMPASAYRTAQQNRPGSSASHRGFGGITATTITRTSVRPANPSGVSSPATRRSSVSSFASELDQRFNISRNNLEGFEHTTDPRMIQAITSTMIGEFLWKYTRKPGRGTQSSTRHRRFFWVHPYTRTLYWSEQDPATAGRSQLKAKSVRIQAVRVVSDDNPAPPGLHRKSLIVVTPGREIMITAQTGSRHETWFNALSYLLLRSNQNHDDAEPPTSAAASTTSNNNPNITAEDVDEFNPRYGVSGGATSRFSRRSRTSVASYQTRASSVTREYPTLVPNDRSTRRSHSQAAPNNRASISNRLSSIAGSVIGGSFAGRNSGQVAGAASSTYAPSETTVTNGTDSIYDASVVRSSHDSAEDLRRVIERQERDADRLENVRACCDGKHDVGSLSHRDRHGSHRHSTMPAEPSRSSTQLRAEA